MNNIYKVIWSKAKNCYVVVSEIARSHTKSASGSEKIGEVARHALLALGAACAIACGGFVNVGAVEYEHVDVQTTGTSTATVYTKNGTESYVDHALTHFDTKTQVDDKIKALKTGDVATNKDNITALQTTTTDHGQKITANTTQIANNTAAIAKKIDTETAEAKLALKANAADVYTKADVNTELAKKADVTALDGKADKSYVDTAVANAVTTAGTNVDTKLADYAKTADVDTKLAGKANKTDLENATNRITTNEGNISALQNKTAKLSDDGTALTGMTTVSGITVSGTNVEAGALKVTGEISNGAGVTTTLADIKKSMERTDTNKTWIGKLNERTTNITHDATGTSVDGVTFNAGAVTGVTSINGTKIGTQEGGTYIHQDNSIWGNMKNVDTQVTTNADNIKKNKDDITALDTKVGTVNTGTYLDSTKSVGDNLNKLNDGLAQEVADRKAADTALSGRIDANANTIAKVNQELVNTNNHFNTELRKTNAALQAEGQARANADAALANDITATNKRTGGITRNDAANETTIEGNVTVDNLGNVTAKGQLTGKGVDAGAGAITTTGAVNAGSLNVTDASNLKGDVTMDKTLSVTGDTKLKKTDVDGTLNVTGESSLKNTKVDGTLTTTGKATFKEAVEMDKGLTVTSGDTTLQNTDVKGALNVTGESSLKNTTVGGTLGVTGATTLSGELTAEKNATFEKDVTVKGTTNLKDTTVDGDLKVTGTITTDKMIFGDKATNNYTEIDHGKVTSKNLVVNGAGETISSSSTFNAKENKVGFANSATGEQSSHKQTSDMIVDNVKNNITGEQSFHKQTSDVIMDNVKDLHNSNNRTQTKTETKDIITDKDGNSSTTSQTASENKTYLKDKDGKNTNSTIDTAKGYDKTIKGENGETSTKQDELNITNTAQNGTITNDAQNIVNNASGNITNKANTMDTNVTGKATESYGSLDTTVNGNETHIVKGTKTETVDGKVTENYKDGQETNVTGDQTTNVSGTQTTTATDINRNASSSMVDKVDNAYGTNTETKEAGKTTTDVSIKGTGEKGQYIRGANESRDYLIKGTLKNSETKTAEATSTKITDGNGKISSTIQDVTQISGSVTDGTNTSVSNVKANSIDSAVTDGSSISTINQKKNSITSQVTDGTTITKTEQDTKNITNTAKDGTITNDAKDIVNNASGNMTNTVGGDLTTTVSGNELHEVDGKQTNKIDGDQENTIGGNQTTTVTGDISNKAENITNEANTKLTDKVGDHTRVLDSEGITDTVGGSTFKQRIDKIMMESKDVSIKAEETLTNEASEIKNQADKLISNKVGENTLEKMEDGKITTSITKGTKANTVISTVDGTSFINSEAAAPVTGASGAGTAVNTTIKGNTITTGKVTMDYAEVMKDLGVTGKTTTGSLEVKGESKLTGKVTMESDATVGGTLDVTKKATFRDDVDIKKNLSVVGDVTANSYKVGDKTYIDANGINANNQKITNVADGSISEGSKDAVNGGQLYGVKRDLEHQVDKVGANAAAMANLRPMEFDPSSKWNIAAAIGNYGSETAAAIGAFYRPNDNVMVNLSTAFGTGENMVGGGVSVRLGKGGNKLSREETNALKAQVADLSARMDALLSVLNPNMSKDFPDVPENHWAYEAVSRLAGNDIVQGYPDGEFHGERTMTRYEMAEIIYNALSRGAEAEKELVEEFKPELQAMAASEKATAERAEG